MCVCVCVCVCGHGHTLHLRMCLAQDVLVLIAPASLHLYASDRLGSAQVLNLTLSLLGIVAGV